MSLVEWMIFSIRHIKSKIKIPFVISHKGDFFLCKYKYKSHLIPHQEQCRNVRSVMIRAKINPSGNAIIISIASVNQNAPVSMEVIPIL